MLSPIINAQKRVIIDKYSRQTIPYVNVYSSENKIVEGTTSDENGILEIKFNFNILHFSHINYEKTEISKEDLRDTIFLNPISFSLDEIVVTVRSSSWVESKLKEIVKEKQKKYQISEEMISYHYETYNLTDTSGYGFQSDGCLLMPQSSKNKNDYLINPIKNVIKYKDDTAGPDFSNIRRIVYTDFIHNFDNKFIKNHSFYLNSEHENGDKTLVWLSFRSNEYEDTNGYIIIDTINNVILESEYNIGTKQNLHNQTSSILRNYSEKQGFSYKEWITNTKTKYGKVGNHYCMTECGYKLYMKNSLVNKKVNKDYFMSTEAKLSLKDDAFCGTDMKWLKLPTPKYIIVFYTKAMQAEEEALNNVSRSYEDF